MTILESLQSLNTYPIPDLTVERVCVDRGLTITTTYTLEIGISQAYELAVADLLVWLHDSPSITEQEVGVNNLMSIKKEMLDRANQIYGKYEDVKFSGQVIGFIGENWNG